MPLIVEDGTGKSDSESFVSVAEADAYHASLGNDGWELPNGDSATEEMKEQALRRASRFISDSFKFKGYPTEGRTQNLAWPRFYVDDDEDYGIESNEIPREIKRATYEVALTELLTPGAMYPQLIESERVKMEQVGPLRVEYLNSRTDAYADRPTLTKVIDIISPLLLGGSRNALIGKAVRS